MNAAADRCSAPKTASGTAKHKLLNATIWSRAGARARAVLAATNPITRAMRPAAHIETAVRENSRKVATITGCTFIKFTSGASIVQGKCGGSGHTEIALSGVNRVHTCLSVIRNGERSLVPLDM